MLGGGADRGGVWGECLGGHVSPMSNEGLGGWLEGGGGLSEGVKYDRTKFEQKTQQGHHKWWT